MESKWKKISFLLILAIAVLAGFYRFEFEQAREIGDLYDLKSEQQAKKEEELQQTIKRLRVEEMFGQAARVDCEEMRRKLTKN